MILSLSMPGGLELQFTRARLEVGGPLRPTAIFLACLALEVILWLLLIFSSPFLLSRSRLIFVPILFMLRVLFFSRPISSTIP